MRLYLRSIASSLDHREGAPKVPAGVARRMNAMTKEVCELSLLALEMADCKKPDAIFTGTALGCLHDTAAFLDEMEVNTGSLLSPTAFIRSTHNTIAGQLALMMTCTGPNITVSQRTASFYWTLVLAALHAQEKPGSIMLVGGMDEHLPLLDQLQEIFPTNAVGGNTLGQGSCMMVLSGTPSMHDIAVLTVHPNGKQSSKGMNDVYFAVDPFTGEFPVLPNDATLSSYRALFPFHGSTTAQVLAVAVGQVATNGAERILIIDNSFGKDHAITVEPSNMMLIKDHQTISLN